jgi:hypothetical protein
MPRYRYLNLYQLEVPTGTNALSQGLVGVISHPPNTNASHLYQLVAPTGTNVRPSHLYRARTPPDTNVCTFVLARVLAGYRCATAIFSSSPPCPSPSTLFFFLSPTRALPPQWHPREFLPDVRWFVHDLTHWSSVEVSYFILPSFTVAILSNILFT